MGCCSSNSSHNTSKINDKHKSLLRNNSIDQSILYRHWGDELREAKFYSEAIVQYRKSVELNPKDNFSFNCWGYCLKQLHKYGEALEKYNKAIEIDPNHINAYQNAGNVLKQMGKIDEAITYYEKAIGANPNNADVYYNWGSLLESVNKDKEAVKKYKKVLEIRPTDCDARNNYSMLIINMKKKDVKDSEEIKLIKEFDNSILGENYQKMATQVKEISVLKNELVMLTKKMENLETKRTLRLSH